MSVNNYYLSESSQKYVVLNINFYQNSEFEM